MKEMKVEKDDNDVEKSVTEKVEDLLSSNFESISIIPTMKELQG